MDTLPLATFLAFVVTGTYTPGPNNIMAMNSARLKGVRRSMPFLAGMAAGLSLVMLLAAVFNLYLMRIMPAVKPYLGAAGALYMLWLAAKPFLPHKAGEIASHGDRLPFITGVLLQLINPKVIFYGLTITASFLIPYSDSLPFIALVAALLGAVGFTSVLLWAAFGMAFQRYFSKHETALNIFMALLLVYCAYSVSGLQLI